MCVCVCVCVRARARVSEMLDEILFLIVKYLLIYESVLPILIDNIAF
jgi:hypothetical protein